MKFSRIAIFICALSLFSLNLFCQENSAVSASSLPDESSLPIGAAAVQQGNSELATPDAAQNGAQQGGRVSTVWVFFRMIFVLIVVCACIYFVMNFMRKKMGGGQADDNTFLRKVAQVTIAPGKSVQIVTLLEHAYLLGVTDDTISLLGEISDKELVDAMNLNADRNESAARARNFNDVLTLFLNPKNGAASEGEKKASSSISEFFQSQKEKLNGKK